MQLQGFHHLSAFTADAPGNFRFYTGPLGLRLVKKTVNQDDVSAYHLFYADGRGSPGTDMTFFDWPMTREHRGTGTVVRTGFRVTGDAALAYWQDRLAALGRLPRRAERDGRDVLDFEDPEGQRLSLVVDPAGPAATAWLRSDVPATHQLQGFGAITMSTPRLEATDAVLTQVMNMTHVREYVGPASVGEGTVPTHVYAMGAGGPAAELHVAVEPHLPRARHGAGGVHHVAFRVPTFAEYDAWDERLRSFGVRGSGPVDRFYFRSRYFREPGGVLFELATDEPGFTADEPAESLGQGLALPPFLEGRRRQIEAGLVPLDTSTDTGGGAS